MTEADFLAALKRLPLHPGADGLTDDVARIDGLVLTTDTLVEGVHFLPNDPPGDVAWKLLAVNLSDLAAKGAVPTGVLLNYPIGGAAGWDAAFLAGIDAALRHFDCPLLGGDTVTLPGAAPRMLTLTAIGRADVVVSRAGARAGDVLYVTGVIGDAGAGLAIARQAEGDLALLATYRRPVPRVAEGLMLAPHVSAMMDVSDGLLIDAARMAAASGLAVMIDLGAVPLSPALCDFAGTSLEARLAAATAGDDYQLLFAAAPDIRLPVVATAVGRFAVGQGISLHDGGVAIALPERLGFQHAG